VSVKGAVQCLAIVPEPKSRSKQTKFCYECAELRKKAGTQSSWSKEEKAAYQRRYMRVYRKAHPRLSTPYVRKHREKQREQAHTASSYLNSVAIVVPFFFVALLLSGNIDPHSDALPALVSYVELLTVKLTGLSTVIVLC